jgi:signal transduction histidine kinase
LQGIYNFTQEIITIFDLKQILNLTLKKLAAIFQVEKSLLLLYRDQRIQGIYTHPLIQEIYGLRLIMEKTLKAGIPVFLYKGKEISHEINRSPFKLAVSIPIQAHDRRYGVLALCNKRGSFKFTEIEMELLLEFLYILAVALENAFMVDEIEKSRKELHLLTGKMITIQEEERKRLAADIHDTLAQALTGISYKIQFCIELAHKNPRLLTDQLDGLTWTVNQTIDQTKELMTSLRPDLIDTIGLVPALKRHLSNFARETGIQVTTYFPQKIQMSSELNICLFRIAQEALTNVYKHAKAKTAEVRLQKDKGSAILIVADQGKGFDMGSVFPWKKDQNKMGLLSMKERVEAVGGSFTIQAVPNQGCRVEARVPLN